MAKKGKYAWRRVTPLRVSREHIPVRRRRRKRPARAEGSEALPETVENPVVIGEPDEDTQSLDVKEEKESQEKPVEPEVEHKKSPSVGQDVVPPDASGQQAVPSVSVSPKNVEGKKSKLGARVVLTLILVSIFLVSGISIAGLLQSTESVGTSGIVVQSFPPPPPVPSGPPPEPTVEIDVYGDSECTVGVSEVEWGSIETGSSISRVVYFKNAGDASVTLSLLTENWAPAGAADQMTLSWNYGGSPIESGAVVEVILTLSIDSSGTAVGEFTFDIVFVGSAL